MKKILSITFMVLILFSATRTFAESEVETETSNSFTLAQAVECATENSNQLKIYQTKLESDKINLTEQKTLQYSIRKKNSADTLETGLIAEGYFVRQAEMSIMLTEKNIDDYKKQLELNVKTDYFNLRSAIAKKEKADIAYDYANENLWIVRQKIEAGMSPMLEDIQATTNKDKAKADRDAAQRSLEYAQKTLNVTLGIPMDTKIQLLDELPFLDVAEQPLPDEIMEDAVANKFEIITAKEQLTLDELNFKITAMYHQSNTYKYQQAKIAPQSSRETLLMNEQSTTLAIYKLYDDMVNAQANMLVTKELAEQAQLLYEIAAARYDLGLIPNNDVINALTSLKDAQINLEQSKLSYATYVAQYETLIK